MKKAIYSGSFDPFTNGHLEMIKAGLLLFDSLVIVIANNIKKKRRYDIDLMVAAIKKVMMSNGIDDKVTVLYTDDLVAKEAQKMGINYIIRGLRTQTDYAYEEVIADINRNRFGIETLYLRSQSNISSSLVVELLNYGEDVSDLVPLDIKNIL